MTENEDNTHIVIRTVFPLLWIGFISLFITWVWMCNKTRTNLVRTQTQTQNTECQTDTVCDYNIVVIHPNNDMELIRERIE